MTFLKRLLNKVPKNINNVWYNQSIYSDEKYPLIFDNSQRYIDCEVGLTVIMGKTKNGENIYYKVTKFWKTQGSDFYFPSDAINCNLKFFCFGEIKI